MRSKTVFTALFLVVMMFLVTLPMAALATEPVSLETNEPVVTNDANSGSDDESDPTLWIILTAGVVLIVGGVVYFLLSQKQKKENK